MNFFNLAILITALQGHSFFWTASEVSNTGQLQDPRLSEEPENLEIPGGEEEVETLALRFADHLVSIGEYSLAIAEYRRFIEASPDSMRIPYAQRRVGDVYRFQGEDEKALWIYSEIVEGGVDAREVLEASHKRAGVLKALGRHEDAASAYTELLSSSVDSETKGQVHWSAVECYLRAGNLLRARQEIQTLDESHPYFSHASKWRDVLSSGAPFSRTRSPELAGLLSVMLPGAGQVYVGQWRAGVNTFIVNVLWISGTFVSILNGSVWIGVLLGVGEVFWYGGNILGAITMAHRFNQRERDLFVDQMERQLTGKQSEVNWDREPRAPFSTVEVRVPLLKLRF